jgi:maltose alpha-D-glucosyltransferase/alpha-amylase
VENQGDGWTYTLDYLDRFLEQCRTGTQPTGSAADVHGAYLALARTLGLRTAELHAAFTLTTGDPAFDPEPVESDDLTAWAGHIRQEAEATLDLLESRLDRLAGDARAEGERLVARRGDLLDRIRGATPDALSGLKTRYHGDYHLGQVLVCHNDFIIIDFEGEPARSLAERRVKHSALRDVAGMLRSFNYASYSALARLTAERPDDFPRLEPFARAWEGEAERAFLQAYEEAVTGSPLYGDWAEARDLLALFVIEKALYEVRYELQNRPEWAGIPLRGLRELIGEPRAPS